jgi:hypothetical protein
MACLISFITNTSDIHNIHQSSNLVEYFPFKIKHKNVQHILQHKFFIRILLHFEAIHTNIPHDITPSISLPACFGTYAHIIANFIIQEYDRLNRNISGDVLFIINNFQNRQLILSQHTSQKLIKNV